MATLTNYDREQALSIMCWSIIPTYSVFYQLVCSMLGLAPAGNANWQAPFKANAAYLRALQRATFSMADPVVTDEAEKDQQRQAAERLRGSVASMFKRIFPKFLIAALLADPSGTPRATEAPQLTLKAETNRVEIATEEQKVVFSRTGGVFVLTTCVRDGRQWRALFDAGRPLLEGPFFNLQPIHYAALTDTPDRKAVEFSGRHRRPHYDWTMRVEVASDIPLLRFTITCHLPEPLTLDAPQPVVALWMRQAESTFLMMQAFEITGEREYENEARRAIEALMERMEFRVENQIYDRQYMEVVEFPITELFGNAWGIAAAYRLHEVTGDPKCLRYCRDFMNTLLRLIFWYEDETDPVSRELHNAGLFYPHCGAHVATPWETAEAHLMIAWTLKHDREHPVTDLLLKLSNLNAIDNFEETISGVERQFVAYNPGRTDRTFRLIFKHASRATYFATIGDGEQELGAADLARGVPLTLAPGEHIRITVRPGDYRDRQLQIQQQRSAQNALSNAYQLMQDVAVGRGRETVSANNIQTFKEAMSACREGRHADAYGKAKGIVDDIRATIHLTVGENNG